MKFGFINARPEQLWHWFKFQPHGDDKPCFLELKLVTSNEHIDVPTEIQGHTKKYKEYVAENWFRNHRDVTDAQGEAVENSFETRMQVLNHPGVWPWVQSKLLAASEQGAEGKDDSGSAS